MDASHLEPALLAMVLGVEPSDQEPVVEDRQGVIAVDALVAGCVDLDPVVEAEEPRGAVAVPEERVERREQRGAPRREAAPAGRGQRRQVLRKHQPPRASTRSVPGGASAGAARPVILDRDLDHLAGVEHRPERLPTRPDLEAREGEVHAQVHLGRGSHRVEAAAQVPAQELPGRGRFDFPYRWDHAFRQVEALLEVGPRVHQRAPRHPQPVEREGGGLPAPPPGGRTPPGVLEIRVADRSALAERLLHRVDDARVPLEESRPPGVAHGVVQHRAPPHREVRGRNEARRVRPVLEQQPAVVGEAVEGAPIVGTETAPNREVVGPVQHVDRIDLEAARVLDEAQEARGGEALLAGAVEVLALEKERGDRAEGDAAGAHAVPGG